MSKNKPLEFYGQPTALRLNWKDELTKEHCPFLGRKCVKLRKSNPSQSIGACLVGYGEKPLIICPHRFLQHDRIFLDSLHLLARGLEYYVVPEITMPGGTIDYFLVASNGVEIRDYLGLEVQSLDTTASGGIWDARVDLSNGELRDAYQYGINWKMSAKTILIQMHHKSAAFEGLGKKLVLAIQSEFYDYLTKAFRTRQINEASEHDSIQFHIYDCVNLNNRYALTLRSRKSTDVVGVEEMLGTRPPTISEEEVLNKIRAKLPQARRLVT
ncbi:MAG: NotI family restriction endonuclease [Nitrososphaerales archaeon]